ncbi:MAG TPA: DUF1931 domain-containing protein [Candidatus Altiarchaeales archaeon]|nr:DUF1931 domain-containing protein [Candidatus Altiarchaeales archaeon]
MADLIVKSKVKEYVGNMNVGADFLDELNKVVEAAIDRAKVRAAENGRSTLKGRDA